MLAGISAVTLAVHDMRRAVRERLSAGDSDEQVFAFMVARYGDFVLYEPPLKGSTLLLWIGPFALLALALLVLLAVARRRKAQEAELGEEERRLVERTLK